VLLSLLVLGYLLVLLSLIAVDSSIFKPPKGREEVASKHLLNLSLQSGKGDSISAYYRAPADGWPVLLWSHGNAEDLGSASQFMDRFAEVGFGVMAYDYPGYGLSDGEPSEDGCYQAANLVYDHLTGALGHDSSEVVLVGQSLGSGPSCWLAERVEHRSVVLISPFLSIYRIVTRVPLFPGDRFSNVDAIENMYQPLLIIHGKQDAVVPFWHGERLYQLSHAREKQLIALEEAGHNSLYGEGGKILIRALVEFTKAGAN